MRAFIGVAFILWSFAGTSAQSPSQIRYLSFAQGSPVLTALGEPVPPEREWDRWIAAADAATRARVAQGDEATIVNLLLFGTSFTSQPRILPRQLDERQIRVAVSRRLDDFERALEQPGTSDRLLYARRVLSGGGPVRARLLSMLDRRMKEAETLARLTAQAEALADPSLQFAERSRLYRDRGLASDTSVRINFAVEEAIRGLTPLLSRGSDPDKHIQRVAIVGPGLDVVDKEEGYDVYPPQTLQPFAIIDSLIRLGLADAATLGVTTFDVSARVNDHLVEMERRANMGAAYVIHLPLDGTVSWTAELLAYFNRFGDRIGAPVPVTIPPGIGFVRFRAVSVRPSVVQRISARDLNITAQMAVLRDTERFDLIIGTNIFLYYDRVQQGLAMSSVAAMLRPGGILLSNNALVEVPASGMQSIGYSKTLYSNREEDGDVIVSYQKRMP